MPGNSTATRSPFSASNTPAQVPVVTTVPDYHDQPVKIEAHFFIASACPDNG
jgi:hypothetical protein